MKIFDIQNTLLGKTIETPLNYDASVLFRIPRSENRLHYQLDNAFLPFVGCDVWNCYELSFLTDNGLPISRVVKLMYSAESEFLVESKSLKIYLNTFNMDCFGTNIPAAVQRVTEIITRELSALLETTVTVVLFDAQSEEEHAFPKFEGCDLGQIVPATIQESIQFSHYNESPQLLRSQKSEIEISYTFYSDLLRSNCRVTNQPDWGDLYVSLTSNHKIDLSSIIEYLVSFRKENHFHEEVVEMIYKRFYDFFEPTKLMVAAMYTRRGGIDINPIRASHAELIDEVLISPYCRVTKTLRQ